jgi:chromosome segregation ATPase
MEGLTLRIGAARERVQELLRERTRHVAAIAALEAEVRDGHREADVLKARIVELEQENEVLRAVKTTPETGSRTGTKEKIDELVNEIDRCLALLDR